MQLTPQGCPTILKSILSCNFIHLSTQQAYLMPSWCHSTLLSGFYISTSLVTPFNHLLTHSQLQIFFQLMQQSPEILAQLGITPESLREEMRKLENMEKLKVCMLNVSLCSQSICSELVLFNSMQYCYQYCSLSRQEISLYSKVK